MVWGWRCVGRGVVGGVGVGVWVVSLGLDIVGWCNMPWVGWDGVNMLGWCDGGVGGVV